MMRWAITYFDPELGNAVRHATILAGEANVPQQNDLIQSVDGAWWFRVNQRRWRTGHPEVQLELWCERYAAEVMTHYQDVPEDLPGTSVSDSTPGDGRLP